MKNLTFAALAFFAVNASAIASAAEPLLPSDLNNDQPEWDSFNTIHPYRDGVLGTASAVYFAKFDSKTAQPFTRGGLACVWGAERAGAGWVFFGFDEDKLLLAAESAAGELTPLALPEPLQKLNFLELGRERPRLVPGTKDAALIHGRTLWWLTGGAWKSRELPQVPQFYDQFTPNPGIGSEFLYGNSCYLLDDVLFVGWNRGEWGGMLASIDLAGESPAWIHLSGKKPGDPAGIPSNDPVKEIESADGKTLWVLSGSGLARRGADGTWASQFADDVLAADPHVDLALADDILDRSAITLDPQGRVYFAAFGAGIYRLDGKKLTRLLDHSLFHIQELADGSKGHWYLSDLAIGKNGEIFVSAQSHGLLAFRKDGEKWQARQILVGKE